MLATKKKNKKGKRILIVIALVIAGLLLGTAAFAYYFFDGGSLPGTGKSINKRVSVLLIGTDKRPGQNSYNADTIIVASFDPQTNIVSMLSIPRDTRVTLPGSEKNYKINAIPSLKGIPELKKQVTDLTGIKLNGYVLTNFTGFKDIIDTLGGITLEVEKDMKYETGDKEDGYINLKAGVQELDGSKALQYVRFRNDATADIGRTARQQKLLAAVGQKMLEPATILKLPKLVPQFFEAVETDLTLKEIMTLAGAAKSLSDVTIVSQTLPGDAIMLNGLSYWEVNREKAREVAGNLLLGQTTDKVWDSSDLGSLDPNVKANLDTPETEVSIDIAEIPGIIIPKAGEVPVTTIQTKQYSGKVTWSPDDSTFLPGEVYTATITLVPKAGYTLKEVKENFFIVPGATTSNASGSGVVTAIFPKLPAEQTSPTDPITELPDNIAILINMTQIAGVTPPEAGASPVTSITETEQYTGTVKWMPVDNPFIEGRQYTAIITLVPKDGYTLEGIAENSFTVPGASTTNAAGSGIVTAVFPPAEPSQ
ncbi:MAG: LCP family protein [Peptococcaceae bacterium]|nr:LCP family protein [Peptococcaceae bacterium]